ncbi:MAG: NADH-quinone oxidoreductase subunit NuoK [Nitrospirales bacterium]|nr:NADH-quinone oxidoreductase subunit NuoK [Nitrospirales bacterium]
MAIQQVRQFPNDPTTMIPLSAYVFVSAVLFMTGLIGVLVRRNFIIVLMSVEIMLNAANINLVAFSHYLDSLAGQLAALFIIAIAAGEAAVGLAIIIVVFRGKMATNVDEINILKW